MGIAPERTFVPSVASQRIQSRALRTLPLTALVLDLALVSVTVLVAAYMRSRLGFDSNSSPGLSAAQATPLGQSLAFVALPLVVGWVALVALRGGYDQGVFGAGADEYKAVVNAS